MRLWWLHPRAANAVAMWWLPLVVDGSHSQQLVLVERRLMIVLYSNGVSMQWDAWALCT